MSDEEKTDPGGHCLELEPVDGYEPIAGAPDWAQEGDLRALQRAHVLQWNLELVRGEYANLRGRVVSLEARVAELEAQHATEPAPPPDTH